MARVAAMEIEALATVTSGAFDAVKYWPYQQEVTPYMTNRLGEMTPDYDAFTEDIEQYNHTILMRIVVDHVTAGYAGDKADLAYQYAQAIETYFRQHPQLTTDAGSYTTVPNYLQELTRLISHTGLVVFDNGGIGALQLGIEFTLQIPFLRETY